MTAPGGHDALVREQFARQAEAMSDPRYSFAAPAVLEWIVANLPLARGDEILDVAGGAGQLARALAPHVRRATVLDMTPEMLAAGRRETAAAGVENVAFERGDAARMPYADASFDLVVTRFAVHHFERPAVQLAEMARVCRPGGHVAAIDLIAADPGRADGYNRLERLRDPSHAEALTAEGLTAAVAATGVEVVHVAARDRAVEVERWLSQTSTPEEAAAELRALLGAEADGGAPTGMRAHRHDGRLWLTHRFQIVAGRKPTHSGSVKW